MTCQVELTPTAEDDLRRLDSVVARRIIAKLLWLAENVETVRHQALSGAWKGVFKLRVGDYRALYTREAPNGRIIVHFVRHRRETYKIRGN